MFLIMNQSSDFMNSLHKLINTIFIDFVYMSGSMFLLFVLLD